MLWHHWSGSFFFVLSKISRQTLSLTSNLLSLPQAFLHTLYFLALHTASLLLHMACELTLLTAVVCFRCLVFYETAKWDSYMPLLLLCSAGHFTVVFALISCVALCTLSVPLYVWLVSRVTFTTEFNHLHNEWKDKIGLSESHEGLFLFHWEWSLPCRQNSCLIIRESYPSVLHDSAHQMTFRGGRFPQRHVSWIPASCSRPSQLSRPHAALGQ